MIRRCWDGKNLDSPDHQSHMYSTTKVGTFVEAGPCPASHPVRMPQLAYETIWDTRQFNDKALWPSDGSQPFVVRPPPFLLSSLKYGKWLVGVREEELTCF
jgi:hypothetical protein